MSQTIDAATGYYPVFGEDITITGHTTDLEVIGHSFKNSSEEVTARDASGDTKVRVLYDIGANDEMTLDVIFKGADAATVAANNTAIANGTTLVITSTKHPKAAGNWLLKSTDLTGSNTGLATGTLNLVRKLS